MDAGQAAYLDTAPVELGDEDAAEDMGVEDDGDEEENNNSYGPGNSDVRQKLNPLDETEFQNRVGIAVQAAETYIDTLITPARVQAAEYYRAAPFGDEEAGRSQVVLSEVRDTIQSIMPSLMRIFTSGQRIVEYMPRTAEDVKIADQASDAINFVFNDMNPGFQILHSAFKDALLKKLGIVTWWAESEDRVIEKEFSGLLDEEITLFQQQNPGVEFLDIRAEQIIPPYQQTYTVRVRLVDQQRKYRVRALPPECFICDRRARDTDKFFDLVGYRDLVTVSELIEMGYNEEDILEHGSPGEDNLWIAQMEDFERNRGTYFPTDNDDPALRRVKYMRIYMRIDRDGDGIAELRCIECIGRDCFVLKDYVVDHAPFALFCPDPEPHAIFGHSIADVTMDLQRIKSHVLRATLDSLAQSIFPRTAVVEGQANIDDVLNKEVGSIIRMRQMGAVQDLSTPFVGQSAMPIIQYLDEIKAQRTGVTPASQGLDAELLQSTTASAVSAQISAAQERIEIIARTFAENGMRQLFRGLLKLITQHQDKPLLIRLRGEWMPIDPTTWDADMDCTVSVALGRGDDAQQMAFLTTVAQKQEQIIQTMGMDNPLVKLSQYQNTLAQIVRKAGYKNPDSFFSPISPEQEMQLAQAQAAAKANQKDPNQLLAEVEMAKAQAETYAKLQQLAIDRAQLQLDADLKRDQMEADIILKAAEIAAKGGQQVDWPSIIQMTRQPRPDVQSLAQSLIDNEKMANAQVLSQIGLQGQGGQQPQPQQQPMQQPQQPMAPAPMTPQ
ncbi:MAG: hypothetical protein EBT43_05385 [Methylocystaceae bacterium]|nr:hypothetical protein [Methylocystaceae bacterium]